MGSPLSVTKPCGGVSTVSDKALWCGVVSTVSGTNLVVWCDLHKPRGVTAAVALLCAAGWERFSWLADNKEPSFGRTMATCV